MCTIATLRSRSQTQTDHEVEAQDAHCRQWCFLAHDGRRFVSLHKRRNPWNRPKTTWRSKPRMASSVPECLHPRASHPTPREASPSSWSVRTLGDQEESTCCTDNFVSLVAVTRQKNLSIHQARLRHEKTLCQSEKRRTPCFICWNFSLKV